MLILSFPKALVDSVIPTEAGKKKKKKKTHRTKLLFFYVIRPSPKFDSRIKTTFSSEQHRHDITISLLQGLFARSRKLHPDTGVDSDDTALTTSPPKQSFMLISMTTRQALLLRFFTKIPMEVCLAFSIIWLCRKRLQTH